MASGATVANAFVQIMPSMEGATSNITNSLVPQLSSAGESAGSKFGSLFAGKAGIALKGLGAAFAGIFAVSAVADAFGTVEAGFNKVKIATGATGEDAKALEEVYLNVSKSVSGSFEDVGEAVGELNTRFGLTGEALETAAEQTMKYAKVNGVDAKTAVADVSRMMNNAGISADEYGHVLDTLTVAAQQSGIDVSKLATSVTENAASFRELGFSTDESIAMLANFEKAGVNSSQVLSGMKKGVAEWAKEGKSASEGFNEFVSGIKDGSVTSQDAIDLFGSRAGIAMYDAAKNGQLDFEQMYDAITNGSEGALDDVYEDTLTASEKFDILGKNLQAGFFEILEPIVDAIMPLVDGAVSGAADAVNGVVDAVVPFVEEFSATIAPIIEDNLPTMQALFQDVMTTIGNVVQTVWPVISEVIGEVMTAVMEVAQEVWPSISEIVTNAAITIAGIIQDVWPVIKEIVGTVFNAIKSAAETVWPVISGIVTTAVNVISSAINGISSVVNGIRNTFNSIREAITNPIETAKRTISDAVNAIKGFFAGLKIEIPLPRFPKITLDGGEPPWGIAGQGRLPSFDVQWAALGGFVSDPTILGAGESYTEMVLPKRGGLMNDFADAVTERVNNDAVVEKLDELERNLGYIIATYTPTATPRDLKRIQQKVNAYA